VIASKMCMINNTYEKYVLETTVSYFAQFRGIDSSTQICFLFSQALSLISHR